MIAAFRHAAYDTPWWANPSRRPGRFHRAGGATTQYLSLHPLGPAAEMLRHHVGPAGLDDAGTVQLNLWTAQLPEDGLVTVDFDTCSAFGITPDELVSDDYAACQRLADRQRREGARGLVVPSAALPGTGNLVVFGVRVLHPYLWAPVTPEETRTGHLTDGARPPAEVAPLVRWFGDPHAGLGRWRASGVNAFFDDPVAVRW